MSKAATITTVYFMFGKEICPLPLDYLKTQKTLKWIDSLIHYGSNQDEYTVYATSKQWFNK